MARSVRDHRLETRAARSRLPARQEPYRALLNEGFQLGYYRGRSVTKWVARHEGLEDGLTLAQDPGRAVGVSAGTCTLPSMQFPDAVGSVAIGGDNDAPGRAAAMKAAEAFCLWGLTAQTFLLRDPHWLLDHFGQQAARNGWSGTDLFAVLPGA